MRNIIAHKIVHFKPDFLELQVHAILRPFLHLHEIDCNNTSKIHILVIVIEIKPTLLILHPQSDALLHLLYHSVNNNDDKCNITFRWQSDCLNVIFLLRLL